MTLLFFLMLVFQGIWYTQGSYEYYVNDATLMNGAALFYKNFAGGGILLVIIIALNYRYRIIQGHPIPHGRIYVRHTYQGKAVLLR